MAACITFMSWDLANLIPLRRWSVRKSLWQSGALGNLSGFGKFLQVVEDTTLHEVAVSTVLNIPKACGMGICGASRVRVLSGEVDTQHNGGIN